MKQEIEVVKSTGVKEPFSILKLRRSLEKAHASPEEIEAIITTLLPQLYQGIKTKHIHKLAFRLLRKHSRPSAARYHLKKGIMELGPSGFPFERYIAKVFEHQGYSALVDQILEGSCVKHEVDVVARKKNELVLVECKYKNTTGFSVDVKTPLYIRARFDDLLSNENFRKGFEKISGWVATNAKFTSDAIDYGKCKGLNLLSWDYPSRNGLKDIIDTAGLYPLTCLTGLKKQEKQWLLAKNYVLVRDIYRNAVILRQAGVEDRRIASIAAEGARLCEVLLGQSYAFQK